MRRRIIIGALAALAIGCAAETAPQAEIAADQVPSAPTRWVEAARPGDRSILESPARAVAAPGASAHVSPPFTARVVRIAVSAGDVVRAGDPLLEVVMPEVLDAAASWVGSGRRRAVRQERREQLEALRGEGLVERGRVFEQEASVVDLDAERARALAVLRAAGVPGARAASMLARGTTVLHAPIDGVVVEVSARLGEVRNPEGAPLIELLGSAPARIEARLSRALPEGASLSFVPLDGEPIALRSEPDALVVDPADGTRRAWISPEQPEALPDGLRGTLVARIDRAGVVQVPARAVGRDPDGTFVLRRADEGSERVPVRVLAAGGGSAIVEALAGEGSTPAALAPGQPVASDAAAAVLEPGGEE